MINPDLIVTKDRPLEWPELPEDIEEFLKSDRGIMSRMQKAVMDKIVGSQWFFVRNELAAPSAYGRSVYLTLGGIECPFNGMHNLILVLQSYDEQTRSRLISSMRPGTIEPITEERAKRNVARIQAKGYLIYPSLV